MKIRNKITLWITGAGLVAGLLFSLVIALELVEQPYELLDGELDAQAHALLSGIAPGLQNTTPSQTVILNSLSRSYWLKIFDSEHNLIYTSSLANLGDVPLRKKNGGYNISVPIPREAASLEQDDSSQVTFRVRVFTLPFAGQEYLVQIARPMEKLQEELADLLISIAIGLALYTAVLLVLGYFIAGKILQPVAEINTLAREISENTLDKRIPLGSTKDELYTLSSSLNQMFDRLQFSFQRQKEFIANASHELKTPLAMQRLFFNEARQRQDLPEEFLERLGDQEQSLHRMNRLIKNLLDLSALELEHSFAPVPVNLSELCAFVLEEYEEIIQAAAIQCTVELQDDILLQADEEKIRRLLINLIDNAIKYNLAEHGKIRIKLAEDACQVSMEVYNTGQGIPKEELHLIFNQFYRVEKSRATTSGGSGLGLTIVKRIVELHQGHIEIQSKYGEWVCVQVLFPALSD